MPDRLFIAYRDHLVDIAPLIASVRRVELRSRTALANGQVDLVHLWHGHESAVPAFIRPFVQPEMLTWIDTTRWDQATHTATWRIDLPSLGGAVRAAGSYRFLPHPTGGQVVAEGDFTLDGPGLPPAFATVRPMIERMVVGLLEPMVADAGDAVVRWLESRA